MKKVQITAITDFEWYDGFVSGLVFHAGGAMWVATVAFYPDELRKEYVLVELADGALDEVQAVFSQYGFGDALDSVWKKCCNTSYVASGIVAVGSALVLEAAPAQWLRNARELRFPCLERSIDHPWDAPPES
jgi:hypothetical protein